MQYFQIVVFFKDFFLHQALLRFQKSIQPIHTYIKNKKLLEDTC